MAEVRYEVKTFVIEYACDECGEGEMKGTGNVLMTSPVNYPHQCNKCGAMKTFTGEKYPKKIYEQIGVPP